ncbi:hypothetical protein E4T48_01424 [Aureobasidium sp. EXF-10727]|nr:hypothetical protein E4T48_01424 [Aureobasidium sp. EXF-10727]
MVSITSLYVTLLLTVGCRLVVSQQLSPRDLEGRGEGGGWTNAYCMGEEGELSAATSVVCPSWAPIRCDAIQEDNYCCTPSTYCARSSFNTIGCCPWGQTCNPVIIAGDSQPQPQPLHPSTWAQPQASTVYVTQTHPTTTVVYAAGQQGGDGGGGGGVGGQGQQQQGQQQGQQYCSTLYAHGANLPTTQAGTCGTILIANAAERGSSLSRLVLLGWVFGVGGGVMLQLRLLV